MADILTNLRETSFCMGFALTTTPDTPNDYLQKINNHIICPQILISEISRDDSVFSKKELETILKGYELGLYVKAKLGIQNIHEICWVGSHNSVDVIDVVINKTYRFSLKENSYILKNMGLYEMLNIITNSNLHKRGLNVFEAFSDDYIKALFEYVKQEIIKYLTINKEFNIKEKYIMSYTNDTLYLELNGKQKSIANFSLCSYYQTRKIINNKEFEQTISKFIRFELNLKNDEYYKQLKFNKSNQTAYNLDQYIKENAILIDNPALINLFNIYDYSYFFAKYDKSIDLYHVPNNCELTQNIIIKKITTSVAQTQLNLVTTLYNQANDKELTLINQLRYSHGQLNGSPEAKLYIDTNSSLDFIYNSI